MTEEKDELNEEIEEGLEAEPEKPEPDPDLAAEARKYGWKPREEFNLAPDGWVDAGRFLQLPTTQLKMSRDIQRNLAAQLKERDENFNRLESMTKVAIERVRDQERSQYAAKIAELEQAKRAAAEIGDVEKYDALARQQTEIKPPLPAGEVPQNGRPVFAPDLEKYLSENAWTKDQAAFAFAKQAIDRSPDALMLPPLRQVQWAEKRVREFFPDLFPEEKRQVAKVDGGGIGFNGRTRERGADDLPSDARKQGEEFVKEGIFKSLSEYATDYFKQEAGQ